MTSEALSIEELSGDREEKGQVSIHYHVMVVKQQPQIQLMIFDLSQYVCTME